MVCEQVCIASREGSCRQANSVDQASCVKQAGNSARLGDWPALNHERMPLPQQAPLFGCSVLVRY